MYCSIFCTNPSGLPSLRRLSVVLALTFILTAHISPKSSFVAAFPGGAGHCSSGKAIANSAHGTSGSGSLDDGNYELRIEEIPSGASSASSCRNKKWKPQRKPSLSTGTEYKVTLSTKDDTSDDYFRGFLFRLSSKEDGEDVKRAMIVSPDFVDAGRDHTMCISTVAGVTHVNASDKSRMDVILNFDQPIEAATLEVTVVRNNQPMASNLWYYDSYDIIITSPSSSKSSKSAKSCRGIKFAKGSSKKSKKSSSSKKL
mmetsp:Transcript_15964/g.30099  ORF Transcript_15964/g.30099 Transcript_15964/m.30099 type:complete len:257 (+) Transcript_15964:320-1090(+)